MSYEETKQYLTKKYNCYAKEDILILVNNIEALYISKKMPYVKNAKFDKTDIIATSWVIRAVIQMLERGDVDITSYGENGLSVTLGESMLCEITPCAGVGGN